MDLELFNSTNITDFGRNPMPIKGYSSHRHSHWEIVLQLTGQVNTTVGDKTFLLSKGDILVMPPYTDHSGVSETPFTNIYIGCRETCFSDTCFLKSTSQKTSPEYIPYFTVHDTDSGVFYLMQILYKVLCKKEEGYLPLADSLLNTIQQYILKYTYTGNKYPVVSKLQDIIGQNLDNPDFDLTTEIGNTGFCPDYLRRCFKEDTGKTPLEYLTRLRISLAQNLLIQDDFNGITDVALRCGFNDSFYFSTCFKKHTGLTPSQYRRQNR